jgi:N utilization substance protein A
VGACVGVKGSRVRPIIDELRGERIDLIAWSSDPAKYIAASLSPAKVISVNIVNEPEKQAEIIVSDDMLSLAIGKSGQNARLAARLTGWHIDIKSETQRKEAAQERVAHSTEELAKLEGVGPKTTEILIKGGWGSIEKLAHAKPDDLTGLRGVGEKTAVKIVEAAKEVLAKAEKEKPAEEAKAEETKAEAKETKEESTEPHDGEEKSGQ